MPSVGSAGTKCIVKLFDLDWELRNIKEKRKTTYLFPFGGYWLLEASRCTQMQAERVT